MGKKLYREYDDKGDLIKLECFKCNEIKTVDNFRKDKRAKDGYNSQCKSCAKEQQHQYYENNKDKIKEHVHQYSENNKDKIKERRRQYRENNKDKIKEQKRQWRENNKDKINERQRQHYENNKDKFKEQHHQYYENNKDEINERNRKYYENNKDKINERNRKYNENHKEEIKEYNRQYRAKNRDEILEHQRQYYENNKDEILEYQRQYRENNKDKIKKRDRRYREDHKEELKEKSCQWHKNNRENIVNEEIKRIYKNVTKKLYPHNGIQYGIIYGVHCIPTDKWYIGQTVRSFNIRYQGDFFKYKAGELSEDNKKAQLLQEDIEKYGEESFEIFEVLDVAFSEKELDEKEAYYIDQYKAYDEGYNSNRGNIFKHNKLKRKEENDYQREEISRIC